MCESCISSATRGTIEQFMVFPNNRLGRHVVKHPLSLTSIEEKKQRWIQEPYHN